MDESPVYRRPVQFRVLGPLEVDAGDGPIPLGGRKQRAVLASLLVRANEVVSADALIEDVWGDEAPETARNILQTYVANLRKTLGGGRLQTRHPGYVLSIEPSELDAARFDALVADAKKALPVDPNVAIATFDDALSLWRGPALADLHERSSLLAEAARLDELRFDAQEDRIEGLLATGAQAKALAELEPLLARNPLRESLWGLAMLASYREGRQADALNAYGRARELLADELGIDPSPELARLHERILKQDPGLDLRGEPLRGYRLLEKIGVGPLGAVFRGIQPHVGRDVAVKVFDEQIAADPGFVARFERDAQIVAALEHPHIVPMYDYWREPGRAYMVTRYMRGGSLRALRERGDSLERERALAVVAQVASALGFAHRKGVAHGGIGPSNVLLDAEGNAYLGDFRVGAGETPDPGEDLRELKRWATDLLPNDIPAPLAEILEEAQDVWSEEPDAERVAETAQRILQPSAGTLVGKRSERNPYKGLQAFTEADALDFFGRTELTRRLLMRLNEPGPGSRFLAVVGPSGGGKSSTVRAGLVPALRRGGLAASRQVLIADMLPGIHPLDELEAALVRVAARPQTRLGDLLGAGNRGLLEAVELVTPPDAELVLVIDQFEELFTLAADERERGHVLESLRVATVDPSSRLRVIATLRADFYDRPLIYPRFGGLLAERNETVPPLTPDELEQAIRRPAEQQGVQLESGLVAEMIADVAHQPGGLPLLQYALTELFERREGDRLTLSAYREIGGVTGALSARADRLYSAADREGRRAIEQVLLRLVTLGEGRQDTRRRVELAELDALDVPDVSVGAVLDAYGRHRLLTFDREPSTREPTVEIAHEALLRAWGRLGSWIDHAREDIRQNERLSRADAEWRGSGSDPSFLMSGARLDQVEAWAVSTSFSIGQAERAYLKTSVDQRGRARREEQVRRDHEAAIERRSTRRLRGLVAVFAVAALVAGTLTVVATNESERAASGARIATARELAAASIADLEVDPERSILLAIEAVRTTRSVDGSVLPEAAEALHRSVVASRLEASMQDVGGSVAWSPAGVFVGTGVDPFATGGPHTAGVIDIRDAETGEVVRSIQGHDGDINEVAFSADGFAMATAGSDGMVKVWDPSTGVLLASTFGRGEAYSVSFSEDGSFVAAAAGTDGVPDATALILDLSTERVRTFRMPPWTNDIAISPDGKRIAAAGGGFPGKVYLIDIATRDVVVLRAGRDVGTFTSVSWSPDGRYVAGGAFANQVKVWDLATARVFSLDGHTDFAHWVDWSPDGTRLVTGGNDATARVWAIARDGARELLTLSGSDGPISGVAFSPDGARVMASVGTSAVEIWDVGSNGDAEIANLPRVVGDVVFTRDERHVVSSELDGSLTRWDLETGSHRSIGPIDAGGSATTTDMSPDGSSVAYRFEDGTVEIVDVATMDERFALGGPISDANWSPDSRSLATVGGGSVTISDVRGHVTGVLRHAGFKITRSWFGPAGLIATIGHGDDGGDTRLEIWDEDQAEVVSTIRIHTASLSNESPLLYDYGEKLSGVTFDPERARIATQRGGTVEIWDVASGERIEALPQLPADVGSIAFSPDGSALAVGSVDGAVRLFDAGSGEELMLVRGHQASVDRLVFSADGSMLASQDSEGTVRIWALDVDDLLQIAREELTRSLTDDECRQYLHLDACPV